MFTVPNGFIARDSEEFDGVVTRRDRADVIPEHSIYAYALGGYVADDYTVINSYGPDGILYRGVAPRYTEDESLDWVGNNYRLLTEMWQSKRNEDYWRNEYERQTTAYTNEWERANAISQAANLFVQYVADKGREYAEENSLCENYERYLMLVVNREATRIGNERVLNIADGDVHDDDNALGKTYRNLMREFLRFGTRNSQMTLGAPIPYGEVKTITDREVLSYDDAVKANEYAIRNGWQYAHRAFETEDSRNEN
jgi:hypothetical protein